MAQFESFCVFLQAGVSGSLTEPAQGGPRDIDLSPGQPLQSNQPSGSLGVIGRRSVSDLGTIGDSLSQSSLTSGGMHDQLHNLQMLEAAYYKLPQPKDSERAKSYTPVWKYLFLYSSKQMGMHQGWTVPFIGAQWTIPFESKQFFWEFRDNYIFWNLRAFFVINFWVWTPFVGKSQ